MPETQPKAPKTSRTHRSRRVVVKDAVRYKTVLCDKFREAGSCPYGLKCQFAHGEAELRPRAAPCKPCNEPVPMPVAGHSAGHAVPYMHGLLVQRAGAIGGPLYLPSGHAVPIAAAPAAVRPPLAPPPSLATPVDPHGTVRVMASVLAKKAERTRATSPLARRNAEAMSDEEAAPEWADWQPDAAADAWQPTESPTWGAEIAPLPVLPPLPAAAAAAAAAEDVALRRTTSGCQKAGLLHCDAASGKVEPLWLGRSKSGNLSFNTRSVCMQIADLLDDDESRPAKEESGPRTPIRKSARTRNRSASSRLSTGFLELAPGELELAPAA